MVNHSNIEPRLRVLSTLIAMSAALAACGGGSSGGDSVSAAPSNTDAITKGQDVAEGSDQQAQIEALKLINVSAPAPAPAVTTTKTPAPAPAPVAAAPAPAPAAPAPSPIPPAPAPAAGSTNTPAGTGYFVDSVNGSDANPGNTIDKPFKTLAKLTGVRVNAGQGVYLKCGSVWRESLTVGTNSMLYNIADGIAIAGYGDCSTKKATISGANDFSGGWSKSGNVWSRAVPAGTAKITRLFVNGSSQWVARWPNTGGIGQEWAIAASNSPLSNKLLNPVSSLLTELTGKDLTGASFYVRSEPFAIEKQTITGLVNGVLQLAAPTHYNMEAGDGYALSDKLWMLDVPGEFFHDTVNNRLYVYPAQSNAQSNLNAAVVEGSVRDIVVKVADKLNITVSNVALVMSRNNGISFYGSPGAKVDRADLSHNANAGVFSTMASLPSGMRSLTVTNSTVSDNWVMGIDGGAVSNMLVAGNTVSDIGTIGHMGWSDAAIKAGAGSTVDGNVVYRSSAAGIVIADTGGTQATRNTIMQYCLRLSDCGAIYTAGAVGRADQRFTIDGNQILDSKPNTEGAVDGGTDIVVGIYLDDFAAGGVVNNNTVMGAATGIFVHNGSRHTITNNRLWLTTAAGMYMSMDKPDADYMTNNVIRGNQFVPTTQVSGGYPKLPFGASSLAISYANRLTGTTGLTSGSNSFQTNSILPLFGTSMQVASAGSLRLTAAGWRSLNAHEGLVSPPVTYSPYNANLGPELMVDGEFNNGLTSWRTWLQSTGSGGGASSVSGISGCVGSCLKFTSGANGDLLISSGFNLQSGVPHLIKYTAVLGGNGTVGSPFITRNAAPYDYMISGEVASLSPLSGVAGDIVRYEGMFVPAANANSRLNLMMSTGVPVVFDSVSVKAVTGYSTPRISDLAAGAYAPASSAVTVTCESLGWTSGCSAVDSNGAGVSFPTTLAAGTSRLFLRTDTTWKR